tara:strand:+ start:277 stop:849 length:573 start_codon:yes stop_codon:yes gene_type:complete
MKTLLTTSLIFVLSSLAFHAYALPDCAGDEPWTWDDCFGTYTFSSGSKYVGEYKDNKMHGEGTYTWANGDRYDGEFKNGLRHGKGATIYPNGDRYEGELKNGEKHGNGTYTYSNGSSYVGEFKNGKYNGKGTTTLADGAIFIGEFKDNEMNGQGTLWAEGREIKGIWADDKYLYESAESVDKTELEKYFE